jgi:hypothetical protein
MRMTPRQLETRCTHNRLHFVLTAWSSRGVTLSGIIRLLSLYLAKGRVLYRRQGVYPQRKCAELAPDWATGWCELSSAKTT